MKFRIVGNQEKILEVCEEISKVKEENSADIKKSGMKQRVADRLVGMAEKSTGISLDDALSGLTILYDKDGDDAVILNMPMFIPKMVRFLLKRKITKAFEEIFKKSMQGEKVKVKFHSWGDEDIKDG